MPINKEYLQGPDAAGESWLRVIINTYDRNVDPVPKDDEHYAHAARIIGSEHPSLEELVGGVICLDARNVAVWGAINMSSIEAHTQHNKETLENAKTLMSAYLQKEHISQANKFKIYCY